MQRPWIFGVSKPKWRQGRWGHRGQCREGDPHASPRIAEFQRCHLVACLKNEVLIEEVLKEMKIGLGGSHRALQDVFDNSMQLNSADEKVADSLMEPKREQLRAT